MLRKCSAPTRRYAAIAAAISVATLFRTWLAHSPLPTVIRMSSFPRLDALPESFRKPTSTSAKQTRAFHDRVRYYVHGSDALVHDAAAPARAAAALGVTTAAPVTGTGEAEIEAERASGRLVVLNASMCEAGDSALANEIQRQLGPDSPVQRQGALGMYVADACAVAPPTSAAYLVGDIATCFSQTVFAKARPCGCTSTVLLDLNRNRHFEFYPDKLDAEDTPWSHKLPVAVWRGSASGFFKDKALGARYHLLTRWAASSDQRVNVGMSFLPSSTGNATRDAQLKALRKGGMERDTLLRHRYLISVEGEDVATNLKWALWSKSAVIMPPPTMCSWAMEDRLVPWVHYVPVAHDFSNLTDAVDWCEAPVNAGACERIATAGRSYMEQHRFLDVEANLAVGRAVAAAAVRERGDEMVAWQK